jgi:hypothetical protein
MIVSALYLAVTAVPSSLPASTWLAYAAGLTMLATE